MCDSPHFYREVLDEYMYHMNKVELVINKILSVGLAQVKGIALSENFFNQAKGAAKAGLLRCSLYAKMTQEYDNANRLVPHSQWWPLTIIFQKPWGLQSCKVGSGFKYRPAKVN